MADKKTLHKTGMKDRKRKIREILSGNDPQAAFAAICGFEARQVINILLSFFCDQDPLVRWRAVDAAGRVVSTHADENMESARVIMRRFMWMLNDESGGIGWGAPEAMGVAMARHEKLAREYTSILISYSQESCNFLEHTVLQRGVLWAIGEVARTRPELIRKILPDMRNILQSPDPWQRGYAARAAGFVICREALDLLEELRSDGSIIDSYENGRLSTITVGQMSQVAIQYIKSHNGKD